MEHFRHEKQLLIRDIKNKFLWSIGARYGLALLGLAFIYFSFIGNAYIPQILSLVIFVTIYNLSAHLIYAFKKQYQLWQIISLAWIFQLFDLSAITFLIYLTGWLESPYWFLYLAMIIISGFGLFSYYSFSVFVIAFFSAVFYLALLLSAYLRILPIYGPDFRLSPQELLLSIYNKAVFASIAFFLLAVTIYYFSKLLNQQREELSEKNRKLLAALSKMKAVDRMKDEFVSTASHELRSPLSVVRENLSLIEDGVVGAIVPAQKKLLETSRTNIDRLAKILDNLLDISKIESHSLELHCQSSDLSQLAVRAIDIFKIKAQQKDISIETELPTENASAWVDPEQVLRVFINLLDNAIKYTNPNGKITVGIKIFANRVEAYVSDDGKGISKSDSLRVFERFVHIDKNHETLTRGAGLGLSICKSIVEMHGGKIWLESPPDNSKKGAKFIFILPR